MPSKAHRKLQKHGVLKFASNQNMQQTDKTQENQSIFQRFWRFMDKSPILSAVIIGLVAALSGVLYKVYTYIYWLPYFKILKVDTHYFENANFDKYELLVKYIFKFVPIFLLYLFFNWVANLFLRKVNNNFKKTVFCFSIMLFVLVLQILTIFIIPYFYDAINYISISLLLVALKNLIVTYFLITGGRLLYLNAVVLSVLFLVLSVGLMVYINGYNTNVVDLLAGDVKTIEGNKMVVFETEDQYYVIDFEKNEDNSIKLLRDSYTFVDKGEQTVTKEYFNKIYNEVGKDSGEVEIDFFTIDW